MTTLETQFNAPSRTSSPSTLPDRATKPSPEYVHSGNEEAPASPIHPSATTTTMDDPPTNSYGRAESGNDNAEPLSSLRRRNTDGLSTSDAGSQDRPQSETPSQSWRVKKLFCLSGQTAANIGWIMAGMGVGVTILSLYPSYEALDYNKWEALKKYRAYCESVPEKLRSSHCRKYVNMDLPPPPGTPYIQRRSLDAKSIVGKCSSKIVRMDLWHGYYFLFFIVILVLFMAVVKAPVNGKTNKSAQSPKKHYPAKFAQGQQAWMRGSPCDSARRVTVVKTEQNLTTGTWSYLVGEARDPDSKEKGVGSELLMMSKGQEDGPDWVSEALLQRSRPGGSTEPQ